MQFRISKWQTLNLNISKNIGHQDISNICKFYMRRHCNALIELTNYKINKIKMWLLTPGTDRRVEWTGFLTKQSDCDVPSCILNSFLIFKVLVLINDWDLPGLCLLAGQIWGCDVANTGQILHLFVNCLFCRGKVASRRLLGHWRLISLDIFVKTFSRNWPQFSL